MLKSTWSRFSFSLKLLIEDEKGIIWYEDMEGIRTLVIMPRLVEEILRNHVFSEKIPYVFSSATLANNEDFTYLSNSLGIEEFISFTVNSPFNYEEKMEIGIHIERDGANEIEKWDQMLQSISESKGKTLLLFNNKWNMNSFKSYVQTIKYIEYPVLFEGDGEISTIVQQFQDIEESVLCASTLWEGLDIPGPALENVIIASLPFPPLDPVFDAKRNSVEDPFNEVDLPYMLLRLRQGIGRLIRTSTDSGTIHIWMKDGEAESVLPEVKNVLPVAAKTGV